MINQNRNQILILVSRVFLALIFVVSGLSKIPAWDSTLQYMSTYGIPWPGLFLFPAIFVEVIAGLCLLLGFKAKAAGTVLLLYLVPTTLIFHGFWSHQDMERQVQLVNFMKNLAIMGGLFGVAAHGAGMFSIDYKLSRRKVNQAQINRDRIRAVS